MEVTAITRRRNPDPHLLHQPGDAVGIPASFAASPWSRSHLHHLRSVLGYQGRQAGRHARAADLALCGAGGAVRARRAGYRDLARAFPHVPALHRFVGRWIIAIDEDIDPDNADALFWAMSYRCQPQHDLHGRAAQASRPRPARAARRRRDRGRAHQCDAQGHLRAGRAAQARIHGARARRSGSGSACRRSSRRARGMATISAIGRRISTRQARMAAASNYFALGRETRQPAA